MTFLEEIGAVKTERREVESILLAKAALNHESPLLNDPERALKFAKHNKVLLRVAPILKIPSAKVEEAHTETLEAFKLYDLMSKTFESEGVDFVVIKSFDSLPDMGHDLDFLVSSPSHFQTARSLLLSRFRVRPQSLTHCDKLLGKFSCFLPGFTPDFEIYPTVSQLGEEYLNPVDVFQHRRKAHVNGREVWVTSDIDRVLVRVIHGMYRHNFLKLSDILDFLSLIKTCLPERIVDRVDEAGIGESFIFFLSTMQRFLRKCDFHSNELDALMKDAQSRFGPDRLRFLQRDRLVLPYRVPTSALVMLFLLKAGRDVSRGRLKSACLCLVTPPLILLDFVNAIFGHKLFRRRIW